MPNGQTLEWYNKRNARTVPIIMRIRNDPYVYALVDRSKGWGSWHIVMQGDWKECLDLFKWMEKYGPKSA